MVYSMLKSVLADRSGKILSEYNYTGGGSPAIVDMLQPKVKLDHFQVTSGTYAGWDRFGRTRQQYWTGYSAHRLKTFDQGTLSGSAISGTPTQEQDWSLDGLGNWSNYVTKTSGATAFNQDRTANKVNEITDITESVGPAWTTPGYDAAGSMTTIPQPGNPTAGYTATYDAWHRHAVPGSSAVPGSPALCQGQALCQGLRPGTRSRPPRCARVSDPALLLDRRSPLIAQPRPF
jgi:hypothetical protein